MNYRKKSCGTSLIELLVTISIISIFFGLVLSAVQKVRSAAGSISCQNNLRQLSIANQSYISKTGFFPYGCLYRYNTVGLEHYGDQGFGWPSQILMELGQDQLSHWADKAYVKNQGNSLIPPHPERVVVKTFICPTEGTQTVQLDDLWAVTHYLGIAGSYFHNNDGLLHQNIQYRPTDCIDGLSNTLLFGERPPAESGGWFTAYSFGRPTYGQLLYVGWNDYRPSQPVIGGCAYDTRPFRPGKLGSFCDTGHFWSLHTGGANFAFADGSVRFLSYSANEILPALATRAGGEVVAVPE